MKVKFLQHYNLFIKSFSINRDIIEKKNRRQIIKGLVDLGYIKHKVSTDEVIQILYRIKIKIEKSLLKRVGGQKKIMKTKDNLLFERVSILSGKRKPIIVHNPIRKEETSIDKSSKAKTIRKELKTNNILKTGEIYIKDKYREGDLLDFISVPRINSIFNSLQEKFIK